MTTTPFSTMCMFVCVCIYTHFVTVLTAHHRSSLYNSEDRSGIVVDLTTTTLLVESDTESESSPKQAKIVNHEVMKVSVDGKGWCL